MPAPDRPHRRRPALSLLLALGLSVLALVQANHRAGQGRSALLKWRPQAEALERGEPIYEVGAEGYPTLPLSLLVQRPFHALGERAGALAWAALKVLLAWWIVWVALELAAGRARDFPELGRLLVVLLSFRVLLSDVLHGNLNLLVGATVATAAWSHARGRRFGAGAWLALGAVLKVTPALGLLLLLRKRDGRGLAGFALGLVAFALLLPALFLGWERNLELVAAWWRQMIVPYVAGRELTLLQTEHINQSLLGVLARLTTDSVAIAARAPTFPEDVRVNLLALGPAAFRALHLAACGAVALVLLFATRARSSAREANRVLGEFALLALAMLFLSERSWKHHYVLLALPVAYLAWRLFAEPRGSARLRVAAGALVASALLHGLSGSGVLGARGSDLAEAYGVHLVGGLALFAAVASFLLRRTDEATRADLEEAGPGPRARERAL